MQKTYPYMNARVRAMRAQLVTDPEYRKMRKMDLSEIAEFLSNRGYRQEIDALGAEYDGVELLERALKQNLAQTYAKLLRIAPPNIGDLLQLYYRKFDLQNLKLVLRAVTHGGDVDDLLFPTQALSDEQLQQLLAADSVEQVLDLAETFGVVADAGPVQTADGLQEREDLLDSQHYRRIIDELRARDTESALFAEFLQLEVGLNNVSIALRMKQRSHDYDDIMQRVTPLPRTQQPIYIEAVAQADTLEEALDIVTTGRLEEFVEEEDVVAVTKALDRYKLERGITMLHTHQLSVNPILGYMICKEIEFRNLRMIVRATEEDLDEAFISNHLITGVSA